MNEENKVVETVEPEFMNPPENITEEPESVQNKPESVLEPFESAEVPEKTEEKEPEPEKPAEDPKPEEGKTFTYEDVKTKLEKDSSFMKIKGLPEKVFEYLEKRCSEDNGLAQDIMQEHKTWEKCYKFCENKARQQASKGAMGAMVEGNCLLEWIEDYYRKDDKAEEEEKARKEKERKEKWAAKQKEQRKEKRAEKKPAKKQEKEAPAEEKPKPEPKPKKKSDQIEGQLDIFSMFG